MTWTQEDLAALNAAMKRGVLEVGYPSGQKVKYQTLSDMLELRKAMIAEINACEAMANKGNARFSLGDLP